LTLSTERICGSTVWSESQLHASSWLINGSTYCDELTGRPAGINALVELSRRIGERLSNGPGLALVRGLPSAYWDQVFASQFLHSLGTCLGKPRSQDSSGTLVMPIAEQSSTAIGSENLRGSSNAHPVRLHTENDGEPIPPEVVAFLCLRTAAHGGESLLASGHLVHNLLLRDHPTKVKTLYEQVRFGRRPGDYDGDIADSDSVFSVQPNGFVRVRYSRYWINRGAEVSGSDYSPTTIAAFDAVDELLTSPGIEATVRLAEGDLLVLNNHCVLHGRTSYYDDTADQSNRLLLRIWLD
jgi:hypothetical protein